MENNIQSPVSKILEEMEILKLDSAASDDHIAARSPSVFVIALIRRNFRNMRPVRKLCGIGYAASLVKLLNVYGKFSKPYLTLYFEQLDQEIYSDPLSSLFVGHIPVIHSAVSSSVSLPETRHFDLNDCFWDKDVVKLLGVDMSKISTPDSDYVDASESFEMLPSDITIGDDCLELFSSKAPSKSRYCSGGGVSHSSDNVSLTSDTEGQPQSGAASGKNLNKLRHVYKQYLISI